MSLTTNCAWEYRTPVSISVIGDKLGDLIVHLRVDDDEDFPWAVSHGRTGLRIFGADSLDTARAVAERLNEWPMVDWSSTEPVRNIPKPHKAAALDWLGGDFAGRVV